MQTLVAPLELKLDNAAAGEFHGLASPFGNVDSHGDAVQPGAFAASLAEHKARGTMPALYAVHGPYMGGDPLPVGVWDEMEEAPDGLRVKGRISGLDSDHGRRVHGLVRDGALRALSIGFKVAENGASFPKTRTPKDPRRLLLKVDLWEVSLVPAGSNPRARVDGIKSELMIPEIEEFKAALEAGELPTQRAFERLMRDALGFSRAQAALIAGRGYKSLCARESEGEATQSAAAKQAIADLGAALSGFSLPTFGK